jgi:hypothetical protein
LIVSNPGMFAHDGRLHDPLTIDHRAQPARPRRIDECCRNRAAIKRCIIAAIAHAVISDNHTDGRIELAKTAQHPILPRVSIIARDPHCGKQLLSNAHLSLTVRPGKGLARAKLTRLRHTRDHPLSIASADAVKRLARDHSEIPRLRIHRRRRPHRKRQYFLNQRTRHRIRPISSDTPATEDNVIKLHGWLRWVDLVGWALSGIGVDC